FVSAGHAKLSFQGGEWRIVDNNSTNGTFVNGKRVKNHKLNFGDLVYIMGYKMIVGSCFIAFNNPDGTLSLQTTKLKPFIPQVPEPSDE
ncbi:FHA domain-containing protein, partial [Alkalihalophilus lindianensis]